MRHFDVTRRREMEMERNARTGKMMEASFIFLPRANDELLRPEEASILHEYDFCFQFIAGYGNYRTAAHEHIALPPDSVNSFPQYPVRPEFSSALSERLRHVLFIQACDPM